MPVARKKKPASSLAAAKAKVAKLENDVKRKSKIEAAKKQVEQAKAALKAAQSTKPRKSAVPPALKMHQFKKKA